MALPDFAALPHHRDAREGGPCRRTQNRARRSSDCRRTGAGGTGLLQLGSPDADRTAAAPDDHRHPTAGAADDDGGGCTGPLAGSARFRPTHQIAFEKFHTQLEFARHDLHRAEHELGDLAAKVEPGHQKTGHHRQARKKWDARQHGAQDDTREARLDHPVFPAHPGGVELDEHPVGVDVGNRRAAHLHLGGNRRGDQFADGRGVLEQQHHPQAHRRFAVAQHDRAALAAQENPPVARFRRRHLLQVRLLKIQGDPALQAPVEHRGVHPNSHFFLGVLEGQAALLLGDAHVFVAFELRPAAVKTDGLEDLENFLQNRPGQCAAADGQTGQFEFGALGFEGHRAQCLDTPPSYRQLPDRFARRAPRQRGGSTERSIGRSNRRDTVGGEVAASDRRVFREQDAGRAGLPGA
ncbi:gll1653 [Gloeobacter violaceus PCC 7421]|uniref:Gll1653 protein n=1 Tax=Gloeobacter violaceus (strain ATCC 29082 / PCC 7421) TaxID=251221 RepID=Q7NK27_GLOVI|nr:gll1653 [Gloeobacter violaceus PCC 7421]